MTGYAVKTLQRWDREKRLVPLRTPTNRRMYDLRNYRKALKKAISDDQGA
jgi:DNA-binding transcriptional MerR regulator